MGAGAFRSFRTIHTPRERISHFLPPRPTMSISFATEFCYASTSEIRARARRADADRWLWDGYLASANVTLLVGPWKAGKTTLLSVLLARLETGGTLAGRAVRAG